MPTRLTLIALAAAALAPASTALARPAAHAERFILRGTTVNGVEGPIRLVAHGPFHGIGSAKFTEHGNTSDGTLRVATGRLFVRVTGTGTRTQTDMARCRAVIDFTGTLRVLGGTRRYRGATGRGTVSERRVITGARTAQGACDPQATPRKVTVVSRARGRVVLA